MSHNNTSSGPEMLRHKCKRRRRPDKWKKNVTKFNQNSCKAHEHCNSSKNMPASCIGAPCKDGFFEKVIRAGVEQLFKALWYLGDNNLQNVPAPKQPVVAELPSISPFPPPTIPSLQLPLVPTPNCRPKGHVDPGVSLPGAISVRRHW